MDATLLRLLAAAAVSDASGGNGNDDDDDDDDEDYEDEDEDDNDADDDASSLIDAFCWKGLEYTRGDFVVDDRDALGVVLRRCGDGLVSVKWHGKPQRTTAMSPLEIRNAGFETLYPKMCVSLSTSTTATVGRPGSASTTAGATGTTAGTTAGTTITGTTIAGTTAGTTTGITTSSTGTTKAYDGKCGLVVSTTQFHVVVNVDGDTHKVFRRHVTPTDAMARVGLYERKLGSIVQYKRSVEDPVFGWPNNIRHRDQGVVIGSVSGAFLVRFACQIGGTQQKVHPDDLESSLYANSFCFGCRVKRSPKCRNFLYSWPSDVAEDAVGVIKSVSLDAKASVTFPRTRRTCVFLLHELRPVTPDNDATETDRFKTSSIVSSDTMVSGTSRGSNRISLHELFTCPITHNPFNYPCIAADGETYEQSAIEEHIRTAATLRSPLHNVAMGTTLISNHIVKRIMERIQEDDDGTPT